MNYKHVFTDGTAIDYPIGKVVCIGRNYAEHAQELNNPIPTEPLLFMKPSSSIASYKEGFVIPKGRGSVHYEVEIALLIGKTLSGIISEADALSAIVGIAPALDLTLRDLQSHLKSQGYPWELAKAFDGACVLTPFIKADGLDFTDIEITLTINSEIRQQGNSREMIMPIIKLVQHIAQFFTLEAGDVILTGTPKGVGALNIGDQLTLALPDQNLFFDTVVR